MQKEHINTPPYTKANTKTNLPPSRHAVRPAKGDISSVPHFVRRSPSRRSGFRLRVGPEAGSGDEAGRVGADGDGLGDDRGGNDRCPAQRLPRFTAVYGAGPAISYIFIGFSQSDSIRACVRPSVLSTVCPSVRHSFHPSVRM